MIDAEFIDKVIELKRPELVTVEGRTYSTLPLLAVKDPSPQTLVISTLTGLADYLTLNPDSLPLSEMIVEVTSPDQVQLYSTAKGSFEQRTVYLQAKRDIEKFPYEQYLDTETFIIALQSRFVQTEVTTALLKLAGNITGEQVQNFSDDGVTQKVLAKTGIVQVGDVEVPNPVNLAPYRTFLEVDQPESKFVYRLKQMRDGIGCALYEADGGQWKLVAIERIRNWLNDKLPEDVVILA